MIQRWLEAGYDFDSFWDQTPITLAIAFRAAENRLLRQHNERMTLAYYVALLNRYPARKRFPRLESLLARPRRKRQTWQEQLEVCKMWTVALGGTIKNAAG